jgi:tRNA (guanosine-2'-O-)-methyltransferase
MKRLEHVLNRRQPDMTVVIENIHDPHNVSAMLRSCDAAGVMQVQLVYTGEEFPDLGKKSSASALKWVEQRRFDSISGCYDRLRLEGFAIYATHLGDKSLSLYDLNLKKKVALVFGNEHRGVSDEAANLADGNFRIPMVGMIQSLNVSVACAVTLFEALRQRLDDGQFKQRKIAEKAYRKILKEWEKK